MMRLLYCALACAPLELVASAPLLAAPDATLANAALLPIPQPQALQGHDDENWPASLAPSGVSTPALEARYKALGKMRPGIRRYNM